MQTPDMVIDENGMTDFDVLEYKSECSKQVTILSLQAATEAGFYDFSNVSETCYTSLYNKSVHLATNEDCNQVDIPYLNLMDEKQTLLKTLRETQEQVQHLFSTEF